MNFIPAVQPLAPASPTSWCLMFIDGKVLLPEDESVELAPLALPGFEALASVRHYLGRLDRIDVWALVMSTLPIGWRPVPLRAALMQWPPQLQGLASRAAQVLEWDRAHRFCGVCATATVLRTHERSRECPNCGQVVYPRISPAMMVLVWRGSELLLARAPHFAKGMYSALAGFVEAGESIEDCIVREVAEEVGVGVRNIRYYGSQSWPFPQSLMIAYTAEWAGGEIVPQPDEIEEAAWYDIDALPGIPPRFSIAGHLIRDTVEAMRDGRFAAAGR